MPAQKDIFLIDEKRLSTYRELLDFVHSSQGYRPVFKTSSLIDFVFNFILALANNCDITLVDSDLSPDELSAMGIGAVNIPEKIENKTPCPSLERLIEALKNSSSKITVFTSGTTGLPKKLAHSVENLSRAVRCGKDFRAHVWGFAYNPAHMAGLQVLFQIIFNLNCAVNIFGKAKQFVYGQIDAWRITHISATPTFYRLLMPEPQKHESVLRLTCGGEKSGADLYEKLLKIFPNAKINNIYASTEFGTLLSANGQFFRIAQNLKGLVKIENNELWVHKSLLGNSDSLTLEGGFYKTGDMVEFADSQKELFSFAARNSNLLNVGGYKVNIEEVEDALRAIEGVADARVYGKKNSVLGNLVCADIRLSGGFNLGVENVRNALAQRLQAYKIPRKIEFVKEIESTRTGKIKR